MNTLRNKVQLIGRLGQEPEIITFNDGTKMAKFTLATDDSYKDKTGNKVERTYWHNIVVRNGLVKVVESYVNKGQEIAVEGKLKEGYFADIIIFNPEKFRDKADYTDAFQLSEGLEYSIINGKLSVENGIFTNELNGKVLTK